MCKIITQQIMTLKQNEERVNRKKKENKSYLTFNDWNCAVYLYSLTALIKPQFDLDCQKMQNAEMYNNSELCQRDLCFKQEENPKIETCQLTNLQADINETGNCLSNEQSVSWADEKVNIVENNDDTEKLQNQFVEMSINNGVEKN